MEKHQTRSEIILGGERVRRKPRLWSIAYHSRVTSPMSCEQLRDLVVQAGDRNHTLDVSGVLLFDGDSFLQILEGHREFVAEIYASIVADPRHTRVHKIIDAAIHSQAFAGWDMRLLTTDDLAVEKRTIVAEALRTVERVTGGPSESFEQACLQLCTAALRQGVIHGPIQTPLRGLIQSV